MRKRIFETLPAISPEGAPLVSLHFLQTPQRSEHLTHAVKALCGKADFLAMEKLGLLVQKLWRMKLPCGKRSRNYLLRFCAECRRVSRDASRISYGGQIRAECYSRER
jgi:hypothetical protein